MAKCKSCGAEIRWVRSAGGRMHPINTETKTVLILNTDTGVYELKTGNESHFSSCPDADKWRRR